MLTLSERRPVTDDTREYLPGPKRRRGGKRERTRPLFTIAKFPTRDPMRATRGRVGHCASRQSARLSSHSPPSAGILGLAHGSRALPPRTGPWERQRYIYPETMGDAQGTSVPRPTYPRLNTIEKHYSDSPAMRGLNRGSAGCAGINTGAVTAARKTRHALLRLALSRTRTKDHHFGEKTPSQQE